MPLLQYTCMKNREYAFNLEKKSINRFPLPDPGKSAGLRSHRKILVPLILQPNYIHIESPHLVAITTQQCQSRGLIYSRSTIPGTVHVSI